MVKWGQYIINMLIEDYFTAAVHVNYILSPFNPI
jgi:hypothetical protein